MAGRNTKYQAQVDDAGETDLHQERLKLALEGGEVGLWDIDLQSNRAFWSPTLYELLARDPAQPVTGETLFEYVHPKDAFRLRTDMDHWYAAGGEFEGEYRVVREDGQVRWLVSRGRMRGGRDGRPVRALGVSFDITARKEAEKALRQSREDFARAQAVGQIGSWRMDVGRDVLTWSEENHRIFGLPRDTPKTYETFLDRVHPDDREFVDASWKDALSGQPYDIEHRIIVDGQVKWVRERAYLEFDDTGVLQGAFGITQDITRRKEAEEASRSLLEDLERLVAKRTAELEHAVTKLQGEVARRKRAERSLRDRTQKLEQLNEDLDRVVEQLRVEVADRLEAEEEARAERNRLFSMLNMLPGYVVMKDRQHNITYVNHGFLDAYSDPQGRPCHKVQFGEDEPCEDCPIGDVLDRRTPTEWEHMATDGKTYHVWAFPFTDTDGTSVMVEFAIDITDRKRLELLVSQMSEAERRRIGRELHDTLGQTMSGLAYLIGGLVDRIVAEQPGERATAEHIVKTINEATAQVRALAHGLDPVGIEAQGPMAAIRELTAEFEATRGIVCEFQGDDVPALDGFTAAHLYRIAHEAMSNAADHARAERIDVSLASESGALVLRVADDGRGLPDDVSGSPGMGLRIMRHRAVALGAKLRIDSRTGEGTTVTCILPIDNDPTKRDQR